MQQTMIKKKQATETKEKSSKNGNEQRVFIFGGSILKHVNRY